MSYPDDHPTSCVQCSGPLDVEPGRYGGCCTGCAAVNGDPDAIIDRVLEAPRTDPEEWERIRIAVELRAADPELRLEPTVELARELHAEGERVEERAELSRPETYALVRAAEDRRLALTVRVAALGRLIVHANPATAASADRALAALKSAERIPSCFEPSGELTPQVWSYLEDAGHGLPPERVEERAELPAALEPGAECEWFALCFNPATTRREHPAFPDGVPICPRCDARVRELEAEPPGSPPERVEERASYPPHALNYLRPLSPLWRCPSCGAQGRASGPIQCADRHPRVESVFAGPGDPGGELVRAADIEDARQLAASAAQGYLYLTIRQVEAVRRLVELGRREREGWDGPPPPLPARTPGLRVHAGTSYLTPELEDELPELIDLAERVRAS